LGKTNLPLVKGLGFQRSEVLHVTRLFENFFITFCALNTAKGMLVKMMQKDILQPIKMVNSNLCTGCGTCAGICPNKALEMEMTHDSRYIPKIVSNKCQGCYLCTKVCPASNENYKELNQFIFNKIPDNKLTGNIINCYKGYSTNQMIRWNATSGGLITSLLLFLLKKQLIDGALLTRINEDNPLKAEPFIARTAHDILLAMGSKYVPVPLNQLLNKIIFEDGRFAVVGLSCHIQGIRRAELKISDLREKIAYHFGIVCSRTMSFHGVNYILNKIGISVSEIAELKYRGDGWPSGIKILLKDGRQKFLPNQGSLWSEIFGAYFFVPFYCTLCHDDLNEYSDISFADAWLPEIIREDKNGTSIAITRTCKGEKLIEDALFNGEVKVATLSMEDLIKSQLWPLLFKKRNIKARVRLLKIFGKTIPKTLEKNAHIFLNPTFLDYIISPIPYINIFISKNVLLKYVLKYIPLKLLAFYRQQFKQMLLYHAGEVIEQNKKGANGVEKSFKIVITSSHANNRGDEAAQRNMINLLRRLIPSAKFTVLTISPEGLDLQENARIIQTFSASRKTGLFIILWTFFRSLGIRLPTFNKGREIFEAIEEMANADIIISAPGGPYFGDLYTSHEIQEHLLHISLSKILRKPVMIYGPSMGPFKIRWRNVIRRYLLNKIEIISLRDRISKEYLQDLNLSRPLVYITADSAFQDITSVSNDLAEEIMIAEKIIDSQKESNNKFLVGITPAGAEWNYRNVVNPQEEQERYNQIMAKAIDYLIDKFDATIVFFPQLYGNSDDMPLIKNIIRLVDKKGNVRILSKKWDSDVQQAIISQMELFIGNRYHSVIFALKGKVPTVCLAYEHKSVGIMQAAMMDKYIININDLTYENLIIMIKQAWNQREEIKEVLKSQVEIIRKHSLMNSILAMALINCVMRQNTQQEELEKEKNKLAKNFQQGRLPL